LPNLPGGLASRYQLLGEVGRGGMGVVLHGLDPALGRELAIKVLLEKYADRPDIAQRFREEAQVAGQLQHPGVVPVHELGLTAEGRPYFTMKLVRGTTLDALLHQRSDPAQERPRFLKIFEAVCQTVAYAHAKGVIHRDLKPSNIMVGAFGEVQVMDWGLAKVLAGEAPPSAGGARAGASLVQLSRPDSTAGGTQVGEVLGTPAYMAPEQARGEVDRLDERADVFSLGAVLCEILTGRPPYRGGEARSLLERARQADLADAWVRLDGCDADPELTELARHCLTPEATERPRDASEVARAVEAYLIGVEERARLAELERVAALARAEQAQATAREATAREVAEKQQAKAERHRADEAERREVVERRARRLTLGLATAAVLLIVTGGGTAWLLQRQHAAALARRQRLEETARLAIASARDLLETGWKHNDREKLAAALAEADKAVKIAQGGAGADVQQQAEALRRQAEEKAERARRNAVLLADLLNVTVPQETARYTRGESGTMTALPRLSQDEQFAGAFRRWGVDIDQTPADELVARLEKEPAPVVQEVIAALDAWLVARRYQRPRPRGKRHRPGWQRLVLLADKLDKDADNRELRRLLSSGEVERQAAIEGLTRVLLPWSSLPEAQRGALQHRLRERAAAVLRAGGPALGLYLPVVALEMLGDARGAERVLRAAVTAHPDQVMLLNALGNLLARQQPPRWGEAIECFRAARALRPALGVALGKALLEAGRTAEAVDLLHDLSDRQPDNPEMALYLGVGLSWQKRHGEAEESLRKALRLRPDFVYALYNLGIVLHDQGRAAEAEALFRKVIALHPDSVLAHLSLGVTLGTQKRHGQAEAAYRKALQLQPDHARALYNLGVSLYRQKRPGEAEAVYRKALQLHPDLVEAHSNLAVLLNDQKRHVEAEAACRQALRAQPDFAAAHVNLGLALAGQKRYAEAEKAYHQAIALRPDNALAHFNLGVVLESQQRYAEAENAYRQALRLNPAQADAFYNLGQVLVEQQHPAEAEEAYRKALQLQPNNARARFSLGHVLALQTRYGEAEAAYRKAIQLQPNYPEAHCNLGNTLFLLKRYQEAETSCRKALELKPDFGLAHINLGLALAGQQHYPEAEAAFRQALRLQPDLAEAQLNLGLALERQQKFKEAEVAFRKALQLKPDYALAHNNLGHICLLQKKIAEAVAAFRRARQLLPQHPGIGANLEKAEHLLELDRQLDAVRAGRARPSGARQGVELGRFCAVFKHRYAAAAGLLADAFAADPRLAGDLIGQHRYFAACCVALAAAGRGQDAGKLDDKERSRLRQQALDWLRADLDAYTAQARSTSAWQPVRQRLTRWRKDADLASVREDKPLAGLPEAERKEWRKLWADVAALLKTVQRD
jgi:tetratricopeptide (TPR) repeat protein